MKRVVSIAKLVALLSVGIQIGCNGGGEGGGSDSAPTGPAFNIMGTRHLPRIEYDDGVSARDCGYSTMFKGSSVWIFGDTFLSIYNEAGRRLLCNSVASTLDTDAGDGIAAMESLPDNVGSPRQLIPLTASEMAYNERHKGDDCVEPPCNTRYAIWPGAIVAHPQSDLAYIFYHKVHVGAEFLDFQEAGHSVAVWDGSNEPASRATLNIDPNNPTLLFPIEEAGHHSPFGSAALVEEDLLYVYGCEYMADLGTSPCLLGRVPYERVLERSEWQFFDGQRGWSNDIHAARPVFDGCEMASVFYNEYLQQYLAIYSEPVTNRVMVRSAPRPEGPWSEARLLFNALPHATGSLWIYDALAHPEFSEDNGRVVYVTYTRMLKPLHSEMNLVAVEFQLYN